MGSASGKPVENTKPIVETNKATESNKSKVPPAPSLTPTRKQEKNEKCEDVVEAITPVEDFVEQIEAIKPEPLPSQQNRRITNPIVNVNEQQNLPGIVGDEPPPLPMEHVREAVLV